MQRRLSPATSISGSITLPGDKSISHRYGMISAIAEGVSRIHNYSTGADCHSTLGCMRSLGIQIEEDGTEVVIHGRVFDFTGSANTRYAASSFGACGAVAAVCGTAASSVADPRSRGDPAMTTYCRPAIW